MTKPEPSFHYKTTPLGMVFRFEKSGHVLSVLSMEGTAGVRRDENGVLTHVSISIFPSEKAWNSFSDGLEIDPLTGTHPLHKICKTVTVAQFSAVSDYLDETESPGLGQILAIIQRGVLTHEA